MRKYPILMENIIIISNFYNSWNEFCQNIIHYQQKLKDIYVKDYNYFRLEDEAYQI